MVQGVILYRLTNVGALSAYGWSDIINYQYGSETQSTPAIAEHPGRSLLSDITLERSVLTCQCLALF